MTKSHPGCKQIIGYKGNGMNKDRQYRGSYILTNLIGEPIPLHVCRIPNVLWKVCSPFIYIDKFDQFGIKMRVPERPVRHERIIEVLRIHGVSFQSRKLRELCLHQMRIRISIRTIEEVYKMRWHTNSAGSQGSVDSGGIPQSLTPNIGGG